MGVAYSGEGYEDTRRRGESGGGSHHPASARAARRHPACERLAKMPTTMPARSEPTTEPRPKPFTCTRPIKVPIKMVTNRASSGYRWSKAKTSCMRFLSAVQRDDDRRWLHLGSIVCGCPGKSYASRVLRTPRDF